ncbi:MAG: hypothetical protein V1907_02695 [Candidatus Kerfeldbacteria bacterium]
MDPDLDKRLAELEKKVDEMAATMRRVWVIYKWTMIITIALIVLPLIAMAFVLPSYMKSLDINGLIG